MMPDFVRFEKQNTFKYLYLTIWIHKCNAAKQWNRGVRNCIKIPVKLATVVIPISHSSSFE